jgi:outer membrane lipoprotein SlyB
MNTKNLIILATLFSLLIVSCQQAEMKSDVSGATYSKEKAELVKTEVERAIIKTASIEVSTNNVEQSIDEIKSEVNTMNGHIFHY